MVCDCIEQLNEQLKPQGLRIKTDTIHHDCTMFDVVSVPLQTVDFKPPKRSQPQMIMARHCPFCGLKIDYDECAAKVRQEVVGEKGEG